MELTIPNAVLVRTSVTAKTPQTEQSRPVMSREDVQKLRDQVRQAVRAQISGAAPEATPTPPPTPAGPRNIIIRGPDGSQTVVGVPSNFDGRNMIPQQAVDISVAFFMMVAAIIIGLPLARAFARRMDRGAAKANASPEISTQLAQLNQSVDAIALEVERISEGQRYTTKLLTEQRDPARQTLPVQSRP